MAMNAYPFFIGGPLDGKRIPDAMASGEMDPPKITYRFSQQGDLAYGRQVAAWLGDRVVAWVHGEPQGEQARSVEMWFRCVL